MATLVVVAVAVALALAGLVGPAAGEVVVTPGNGTNVSTIQGGIDNATAGERVVVRPGTYTGPVTDDANVTLVAPDGATLDGTLRSGGRTFPFPALAPYPGRIYTRSPYGRVCGT